MNTAFYIARKYFFSFKIKAFINVISAFAIIAVAAATASMVIILSVLNGFTDYFKQYENGLEGEIKITGSTSKVFDLEKDKLVKLKKIEGVVAVTEVLEDYAFAINYLTASERKQKVIRFKGVSDNFVKQYPIDTMVKLGKLNLYRDSAYSAVIGGQIVFDLGISFVSDNEFQRRPIQLLYPGRHSNRYTKTVSELYIPVAAGFFLEKYDHEYIFAPIAAARQLFEYETGYTSLEIKCDDPKNISRIQEKIRDLLSNDFEVKNREEQNATLFKAMKIEKLIVFLIMALVVSIASINIFFTLSMLELEKRKDLVLLNYIGATRNTVSKVFLILGSFITFSGAIAGLLIGAIVCVCQQEFAWVKLDGIQPYPVEMKLMDFVPIFVVIIAISTLTSFWPARKATRSMKGV